MSSSFSKKSSFAPTVSSHLLGGESPAIAGAHGFGRDSSKAGKAGNSGDLGHSSGSPDGLRDSGPIKTVLGGTVQSVDKIATL